MTPSRWQYFTMEELSCQGGACPHCGGAMLMDGEFMSHLVALRRGLGFSLPVTSGYRCPARNAEISSTGNSGPHTTGKAVDIAVSYESAYRLVEAALKSGWFSGVGVRQHGAVRYIHLDDIGGPGRPRLWTYP